MLSYTINNGIGTYTEWKLANTVWNLIESYGFGSVERIINWYDTEERKELMANIVLNNEGYAEKLGYGSDKR
jgi:Tfp pilus assembly ATPase PilU